MKKIILSMAILAVSLVACKGEKKDKVETSEQVEVQENTQSQDAVNVDVTTSVLNWKGTKPTGAHNGTVSLKGGSISVENGALKSGEFVIDMTSIVCLDIPAEEEGNAKLVGHLSNEDFFDVAKYPTSKFVITSVAENEGKLAVTGNLTIKDVTKSVTIPATVSQVDGVTIFKSDVFNINRADFNVKYGSKSFFDNLKDKFIDDLMEMSFEVKTKK